MWRSRCGRTRAAPEVSSGGGTRFAFPSVIACPAVGPYSTTKQSGVSSPDSWPPPTNAGHSALAPTHWPFEECDKVLPEHTTAVSVLDRPPHHSVIMVTDGESFRRKEARQHGGRSRLAKN